MSDTDLVKVKTPPFRLSYPSVFSKARDMDDKSKETKYEITMIFDPSTFSETDKAAFAQMKQISDAALTAFFNKSTGDLHPTTYRRPFRDGMERADQDGYGEGKVFAKASSHQQPGIVDVNRVQILSDKEVYPGCWMRATVTAYAYDNIGKGVAFGLHNLQKLKDDADFTGRLSAEDDFDDEAAAAWGDTEASPAAEEGDGVLG